MNSFNLYLISAHYYRGSSAFSNVDINVNVNRLWELPDTLEQNEFHIQGEMSDRLDPREDSSIFTTKDVLNDSQSHVKFISDIQMHELHTFIGADGNGFKGEFSVIKKNHVIVISYFIFFWQYVYTIL